MKHLADIIAIKKESWVHAPTRSPPRDERNIAGRQSHKGSISIGNRALTGHIWPDMFRHSGLSYYTRAPAIREVLGLEPSGF